jgi:cephalosporin-C deacetylase-like acetyl esterase
MRGIDYLTSRSDIDAHNIGSSGCSGGGTVSAYLTALDSRVKAGVVMLSDQLLVGKTFVGMRTEDMIAAVQWLAARKDVDAAKISADADGASGVVLLHAD